MSIIDRDAQYVWHPFTQYATEGEMVHMVRGEGVWLYDDAGNRYMDVNGSWWVNLHGHSNPVITAAISEQAAALEHVIFAGVTHSPAVELAERLVTKYPGLYAKCFYSDNGSTAVEVALKLALQFHHNSGHPRKRILALDGAYHGDTFGSMSVSHRGGFNTPFESMFFEVDYLPLPGDSTFDEQAALLDLTKYAGFIFEPMIQGAAGMRMYDPDAMQPFLKKCRDHGVFLIADEVFTGFGRTGTFLATDQFQVKPDLVALSKGLTGGALPLGATLTSQRIFDAFLDPSKSRAFLHGHSFTANPMACAAALASLTLLEAAECQSQIEMISDIHAERTGKLSSHRSLTNIGYCGTVSKMQLKASDEGYYSSVRSKVYEYFMKKGLLLRPLGNVLYLNPPYCITAAELHSVYDAIEEFLDQPLTYSS